MTVFYVVRHGQSTWNARGVLQGQAAGVGLSDLGREQAERAADELAGVPIGAVYSSDLLRAVQTATPIAQRHGMTVLAVPGLRERAYGCLEGQPSEAAVELAGDIAWTDPDVHPGGGESLREVYRRVASTVAHLARSHQDEAVGLVSHGDTIRVLLAWVDGLGPDEIPWREVANGSITVVRLRTNQDH